jgi:putative endonuclease
MPVFARVMFGLVSLASRRGLSSSDADDDRGTDAHAQQKRRAKRTGIRGETFAYWYLRSRGYVMIARNFTAPGTKGEIDLVGYDGPALAFVEVKTRAASDENQAKPEDAVNEAKRRNLARMARRFLSDSRIPESPCRFDVLAIESRPGRRPLVRLHKDAFSGQYR